MKAGELSRHYYARQGHVYFSGKMPDRRVLALFRSRKTLEVKFQTSQRPPPFSNRPRDWRDVKTETAGTLAQADYMACEWMSADRVVGQAGQ